MSNNTNDSIHQRFLGVDYGQARIGLAMSDALAISAQPYEVLERKNDLQAVEAIREIVRGRDVDQVVVGVPRNMDGSFGPQAQLTLDFIELLTNELGDSTPIVQWDERLTTVQSERLMIDAGVSRKNRKKKIDKVAAAVLLQSYLDFNSNAAPQRVSVGD